VRVEAPIPRRLAAAANGSADDTARAHGHQWTLDGYEARCARCDMELVAVVVRVGRKLTSEIRVAGRAGEVFNPRKHRCAP
jgi:hypothetical protein